MVNWWRVSRLWNLVVKFWFLTWNDVDVSLFRHHTSSMKHHLTHQNNFKIHNIVFSSKYFFNHKMVNLLGTVLRSSTFVPLTILIQHCPVWSSFWLRTPQWQGPLDPRNLLNDTVSLTQRTDFFSGILQLNAWYITKPARYAPDCFHTEEV